MDVVGFLVAADCVHVGIKTLVFLKAVHFKRISFPLCKRVDNLKFFSAENVKRNRSFRAVEVVVHTAFCVNKKGSGNAGKVKLDCKVALKKVLDLFDCLLSLPESQVGAVVFGNHTRHSYTSKKQNTVDIISVTVLCVNERRVKILSIIRRKGTRQRSVEC